MPISESTRRLVWTQAGGRCSICRGLLVQENDTPGGTRFVGEVAHIVAEEPEGPRGMSPLSRMERNQEPNLVLLCPSHHTAVDTDPVTYTVASLTEIKQAHLRWVQTALAAATPWATRLHNLHYINVPRLSMLAATAGHPIDTTDYEDVMALNLLGMRLVGLMRLFKHVLEDVELKAVPLASAAQAADPRGMLVSFDADFRTKNGPAPPRDVDYRPTLTGDLTRDPHIYTKIGSIKVLVKIDPRWITTSTAFSEFRSGRGKFAGLGVVQSSDAGRGEIIVSPLVIGLPSNPFMRAFYGD